MGNVTGIATFGLTWIGRSGTFKGNHSYLFVPKRGEEPFILCMQDLHELNDFCVTLFESTRQRTNKAESFRDAIQGLDFESDEHSEVLATQQYGYKEELLGRMYSPASALIMLYANLVRSLKTIAKFYGEEEYFHWNQNNDRTGAEMPKLRKLLEGIANKKLMVFDKPKIKSLLDREIRSLRNSFMHGDWEAVERQVIGINIRAGFGAVSTILESLEDVFNEDNFPRKHTKLA